MEHANPTLYIQNLNERVSQKQMHSQLIQQFSSFGELHSVIVKKRLAMRGQAFIIFKDVNDSRKALATLQGQRLYGKSMNIRYSKYKSDVISKTDGTYEIERRRRQQDLSTTCIIFIIPFIVEKSRHPRMTRRQMMAQMVANPMMMQPTGMMMQPAMQMVHGDLQLPNKILYLQNVPPQGSEQKLIELFKKFAGFIEIRMVPTRSDVAFAEYENEMYSSVARQALDGSQILAGHAALSVTFARR